MKIPCAIYLAALGLLVIGRDAPAQGFGRPLEPGTFIVTTVDGARVSGKITNTEFVMRTETLGELKVPADRIEMVQFSDEGDTLHTTGGSAIRGKFDLDVLEFESEFGPLRIPRAKILGFATGPSASLILGSGNLSIGIGGFK